MGEFDYIWEFSDIGDRLKPNVSRMVDMSSGAQHLVRVALKDRALQQHASRPVPPLLADLEDLALAVYVADRLSPRIHYAARRLLINLPVRHSEVLGGIEVVDTIRKALAFMTGDQWSVNFIPRRDAGRKSETQRPLLHLKSAQPDIVSLWSGGLDSLAGLYSRLGGSCQLEDGTGCLFSVVINAMMWSAQRRLYQTVQERFPVAPMYRLQVPIHLVADSDLVRNQTCRSRGFLFLLLGSVYAALEGHSYLYVYENGVGAINLPYISSESPSDHSRSVHPTTLVYISNLVSLVLERSFVIENPYLFSTKAQMISDMNPYGRADIIAQTVSCDARRRGGPLQCGYCSSCILRRQALVSSRTRDTVKYAWGCQDHEWQISHSGHLYAMKEQAERLKRALESEHPWASVASQFPMLSDVVDRTAPAQGLSPDAMRARIVALYKRYAGEWDIAWDALRPCPSPDDRPLSAA